MNKIKAATLDRSMFWRRIHTQQELQEALEANGVLVTITFTGCQILEFGKR